MSLEKPYEKFYHDDPELVTVSDYVDNNGTSIAANYIGRETDLLNYQDESGFSNRQRIFLLYTEEEWDQYAVEGATLDQLKTNENFLKGDDRDLLVKVGTEILIPKDQIKLDNIFSASLEPNDTNKFTTFVSENLKALLDNPDYRTTYDKNKLSKAVDFYPQITVWMWVRAIDQFIDVSRFIQQVNTGSFQDGATFNITLAPIMAQKASDGTWYPKRASVMEDNSNSLRNHYNAQSKLYKINNRTGELTQEQYYFHNIINSNDLVFIRFETLDLEKQDRNDSQARFSVSANDIPNKVYDLIGMVDANVLQINPQSAEIGINITGRDLSKAILDDGSYFYIQEFLSSIFPDRPENEKFNNRIYGRLITFTTMGYRSIRSSINLIVNQLSSTGYVPNDVFVGYKNRRNRVIKSEESENQRGLKNNINKSEKNAKNSIKQSRIEYNIENATNQSEINQTFINITDWLNFLIDGEYIEDPGFIENGWSSYEYNGVSYVEDEIPNELENTLIDPGVGEIVRRSGSSVFRTISQTAISAIEFSYSYVLNSNWLKLEEPNVTDKPKEGIWQIIDVEVDPSVTNVRLADTSIAEANGSLIETIRQFCDDPFIEFFTDTYQDRFKFIARRPPFNYSAWKELIDLAIDVENEDLIDCQLVFDDSDVFTYYLLRPKGFLLGADTAYSMAFLPAVVFPEYVDIWGSRPYEKVTNYLSYVPKNNEKQIDFDSRQLIRDLKFMIDINAYMPFARKGQITINGDRRIKKNTCIRLKQTGEICYVTNVQNNYTKADTIDRTTTLTLERCMVEDFIIPKNIDGLDNKVSYFNIVNTDYDEKIFVGKDDQGDNKLLSDIVKNWHVNKDVFDFFLKRRQFE